MLAQQDVKVFWDYENARLRSNVSGYEIVDQIRSIIDAHGTIKSLQAYLDVSQYSPTFRIELQSSGVSLVDCPNDGGADMPTKMMLVDIIAHSVFNPAPSPIVVITADRSFAYAIALLRIRRYQVILLCPKDVHPSITSQASKSWYWEQEGLALNGGDKPLPSLDRQSSGHSSRPPLNQANQAHDTTSPPIDRDIPQTTSLNNAILVDGWTSFPPNKISYSMKAPTDSSFGMQDLNPHPVEEIASGSPRDASLPASPPGTVFSESRSGAFEPIAEPDAALPVSASSTHPGLDWKGKGKGKEIYSITPRISRPETPSSWDANPATPRSSKLSYPPRIATNSFFPPFEAFDNFAMNTPSETVTPKSQRPSPRSLPTTTASTPTSGSSGGYSVISLPTMSTQATSTASVDTVKPLTSTVEQNLASTAFDIDVPIENVEDPIAVLGMPFAEPAPPPEIKTPVPSSSPVPPASTSAAPTPATKSVAASSPKLASTLVVPNPVKILANIQSPPPAPVPGPSTAPSLQVPLRFALLVTILQRCRGSGNLTPDRGVVAAELVKKNPNCYKQAGAKHFKAYSLLAQTAGIVSLEHDYLGKPRISLQPAYYDAVVG